MQAHAQHATSACRHPATRMHTQITQCCACWPCQLIYCHSPPPSASEPLWFHCASHQLHQWWQAVAAHGSTADTADHSGYMPPHTDHTHTYPAACSLHTYTWQRLCVTLCEESIPHHYLTQQAVSWAALAAPGSQHVQLQCGPPPGSSTRWAQGIKQAAAGAAVCSCAACATPGGPPAGSRRPRIWPRPP